MLLKRTLRMALLLVLGIATIAFGLTRSAPVAGQDDADTQAKIAEAMSAAPPSISANAAILDWEMDEAGNFVVLREGSNDWSCFPDDPSTPETLGPDPQCIDQTWMAWVKAFVAGEEPDTQVLGLAYMLQGGSVASNADPSATEPAEGDEWLIDPPHVMILLPGDLAQTGLSTEHGSGGPFIMFAGTPYEHIMMPVAEGGMGAMAEATPSP